jgi:Xaa-Pro aminopeptidase
LSSIGHSLEINKISLSCLFLEKKEIGKNIKESKRKEIKVNLYINFIFEPGYYEDGNFGIRLENVLIIKEADMKFNFGERGYLAFEFIRRHCN